MSSLGKRELEAIASAHEIHGALPQSATRSELAQKINEMIGRRSMRH